MKKSNLLLFLLAMVVCSFVLSTMASAEWSPLPADVKVVSPGPEVPQELARFSGIWEGTWKTIRNKSQGSNLTLVIEEIKPVQSGGFEITLVYSWSGKNAGWKRYTMAVSLPAPNENVKIVFDSPAARLEFSLISKDQMSGDWKPGSGLPYNSILSKK